MTMAPPTPTRPDTTAPRKLSTTRVRRKVTRWRLPQARVVGGQIAKRIVRHGLEDGLHLGEGLVAGAPLVGLEQCQLVAQVLGGLAGDGWHELARIALALGPVAGRALGGGGAAALHRGAIDLHRRRLPLLRREEGGDLVEAEDLHLLGEGLHLRRGALARRVVLDGLLEVVSIEAGQDRHRVRAAVAGVAV